MLGGGGGREGDTVNKEIKFNNLAQIQAKATIGSEGLIFSIYFYYVCFFVVCLFVCLFFTPEALISVTYLCIKILYTF